MSDITIAPESPRQDDVARLMSRLRLVDGVTRVTLADSLKQDNGQSGASVASSVSTTSPALAGGIGKLACGTMRKRTAP